MSEFHLETKRLILRDWRKTDIEPFHAICSDPIVMATLGPLMTREQVTTLVERMLRVQHKLGHCFWAMERKEDQQLIGWCGLIRGDAGTPVADKIEAGWRMRPSAWGKGYATEAAIASVHWAFNTLPDDAVWAITSTENWASRAVMRRLGMVHMPELDFDHPKVAKDSTLLKHVTYRINREKWTRDRAAS